MSTQTVSYTSPIKAAEFPIPHPISPLTSREIVKASALVKGLYPPHTDLQFKVVALEEPAKAHLVPYLEAEHAGRRPPSLDRRAFICYYLRHTVRISSAASGLHRELRF